MIGVVQDNVSICNIEPCVPNFTCFQAESCKDAPSSCKV